MSFSSAARDALEMLQKLTALDERTGELRDTLRRIEGKVDALTERLTRLEVQYANLRESVRNEIVADLVERMARAQIEWDSNRTQLKRELLEEINGTKTLKPQQGRRKSA